MDKIKVLFVCIHNSARSQMAEAFLNELGEENFRAESAGLEPGVLNPLVVEVMKEAGIDISGNDTKSVFDMHAAGKVFDHVITVCDADKSGKCPIFPAAKTVLNWYFDDPSQLKGADEERLKGIRVIRDQIKLRIEKWIQEIGG